MLSCINSNEIRGHQRSSHRPVRDDAAIYTAWEGNSLRKFLLTIVFLIASASLSYADYQCLADKPTWHAQNQQAADFYLYGTDAFNWGSKLFLERWDKGNLTWRVQAERTCSNGISICYMEFPSAAEGKDANGEQKKLSIPYETIDDEGSTTPDFIVLSAFTQQAWYTNGLKVDLFVKANDELERAVAPNIYKKMECDSKDGKKDKLVFLNAAKFAAEKSSIAPDGLVEARLTGKMKNLYDCVPEVRATCLQMLYATDNYIGSNKEQFTIEEWGEWHDQFSTDSERDRYWSGLHRQAAEEGYNLFTNAELQKGAGVDFSNK